MIRDIRTKAAKAFRGVRALVTKPDAHKVDAANTETKWATFTTGGFIVPEELRPEIHRILTDRRTAVIKGPPVSIERILRYENTAPTMMYVEPATADGFSGEQICIPRERFEEMKRREQDLLEANNRYLNRARAAEAGERAARDARQMAIMAWAHAAFGGIEGFDPCTVEERARRFTEESLELVQAVGVTKDECLKVLDYVFDRPAGDPFQEVGGVELTLACLAEVIGVSACEAEIAEFDRVQSKSRAHFEARQQAKMEAGL